MDTETVSTAKPEDESRLRWGVERRLVFLEQRLFWDGTVNRNDLMTRFGVSINQASADIARYQALAPGNMVYDTRAKRYVAGPDFAPKLSKPDAERYLAELRGRREGLVEDAAAQFSDLGSAEIVPSPLRPLDPELVRGVVAAIKDRARIAVTYQSFSTPVPRERLLEGRPAASAHGRDGDLGASRWDGLPPRRGQGSCRQARARRLRAAWRSRAARGGPGPRWARHFAGGGPGQPGLVPQKFLP